MKHKSTPLSTGKNMMITEWYRCKMCRAKVMHVFTMAHLFQHSEKMREAHYTPMRNKK